MARVMKKEHGRVHGKESGIVPFRSAIGDVPRFVERLDELAERWMGWAPFWPLARFPEEIALRMPAVDVFEEGGEVVVKAELPGIKKEEIEVHVTATEVTISGKKEKEEKVERKDYHRYERSTGSFTRAVGLPVEVELEKAVAKYADGVLEIRMPKAEHAKPAEKKVEIE